MKILLDECVPWPMHRMLANHSCTSVQSEGWSGMRNSELLKTAEADFDILITADQNILYQQNLSASTISILELSTNDLRRITAAAATIQKAFEKIFLDNSSRWKSQSLPPRAGCPHGDPGMGWNSRMLSAL